MKKVQIIINGHSCNIVPNPNFVNWPFTFDISDVARLAAEAQIVFLCLHSAYYFSSRIPYRIIDIAVQILEGKESGRIKISWKIYFRS